MIYRSAKSFQMCNFISLNLDLIVVCSLTTRDTSLSTPQVLESGVFPDYQGHFFVDATGAGKWGVS